MADKIEQTDTVVKLHNNFNQDKLSKILWIIVLAAAVVLTQTLIIGYMVTHPPEPKYFAVSPKGRIMPLIPLNQPNLSDSALLQWANTAVIAANTYDFVNYQQALSTAAEYFTPAGWKAFMEALNTNGTLAEVMDKQLIVSAVAVKAPVIIAQGLVAGVYTWKVQLPILITYQSASENSERNVIVNLLIVRIPTTSSPKGIGIAQFIMTAEDDYLNK